MGRLTTHKIFSKLSEINPIPIILVILLIPLLGLSLWIYNVELAHLHNIENRMLKEASNENCSELSYRLHLWDGEALRPDNVLNFVKQRMVELKC